jgi:hypothetical protein
MIVCVPHVIQVSLLTVTQMKGVLLEIEQEDVQTQSVK